MAGDFFLKNKTTQKLVGVPDIIARLVAPVKTLSYNPIHIYLRQVLAIVQADFELTNLLPWPPE